MRRCEIHKEMYYYGLVLRTLDIIFSSRKKYSKQWMSPSNGFDIYLSAGGGIPQMGDEARSAGLSDEDSLQMICSGLLLKPVGWKDGYSVGIGSFIKKDKEVRIKLYLRYPGITRSGPGWHFYLTISPTRTIIKPIFDLPRAAPGSQELLSLFGYKKQIMIQG